MKHLLLIALLTSLSILALEAQNAVYAFDNGNLVQVDPFTGAVDIIGDIDGVNAIAIGSSTFDHYNRRYICQGGGPSSLVTVDVESSEIIHSSPVTNYPEVFSNELEYDLQFDVIYGLKPFYQFDGNGEILSSETYLSQVDPATAEQSLIGLIDGLEVIFSRTSTFNPDETLYTFVGRDTDQTERIFTIDALTAEIVYSPVITEFGNLELQYDVKQAKYFGIKGNPVALVEVDIVTGDVSPIVSTDANALVLGSAAYLQAPSLYMFIGVDDNFDMRLYVFDTDTGQIVSDDIMQGTAVELQADNTYFANERYNKTDSAVGIEDLSTQAISVYPNPTAELLQFDLEFPSIALVEVFNAAGQTVLSHTTDKINPSLDVSSLDAGTYLISIKTDQTNYQSQFVKN